MTNLDSILTSREITLPTKVHLVKAMVFPVVMYGCESWTMKKAEHWKIDAFELWCWRGLFFLKYKFIYFNWRLITSQYCIGFAIHQHESTRYTRVPHPEPPSLLPPCTIPLGRLSAPAPRIQYHASNLDWRFVSYMILYMFQCHSPKSSHLLSLPQSPKDWSINSSFKNISSFNYNYCCCKLH